MAITLTIDFRQYLDGIIEFSVLYDMPEASTLHFPALVVGNRIEVRDFIVRDKDGRPISVNASGEQIAIPSAPIEVSYRLQTGYAACVGADQQQDFIYPFCNPHEVFISTGAVPIPDNAVALEQPLHLELCNLPMGWNCFSNLMLAPDIAAKLEGFFLYTSAQQPLHHTTTLSEASVPFEFVWQTGAVFSDDMRDLWDFIDRTMRWLDSAALYRQSAPIRILGLQAPEDFSEQAGGRTFATGENVIGGIAFYAPLRTDYVNQRFGFNYANYAEYLREGLAHELMHFYTTASAQGRWKSILYPAPDCPPAEARLIGEVLNLYLVKQYLYSDAGQNEAFFTEWMARMLTRQISARRPMPMLNLLLLDVRLQQHGSSLFAIFSEICQERQRAREGFHSAAILLEAAVAHYPAIDREIASMLDTSPDAWTALNEALHEFGYILYRDDHEVRIAKAR